MPGPACDIISVDSALIYRGMDIRHRQADASRAGTGPHRLIDILDPAMSYSAADFAGCPAEMKIADRGRIPLLVGGTMLSISSAAGGAFSAAFRRSHHSGRHREEALPASAAGAHDELVRIDPVAGARIHPNDPQRLCRALEVYRISGKTLTELTQVQGGLPYRALQFAIAPRDRAVLHQRIEQRV